MIAQTVNNHILIREMINKKYIYTMKCYLAIQRTNHQYTWVNCRISLVKEARLKI